MTTRTISKKETFNIRSLRTSLGLTQDAFAHALEMSSASVARWEEKRSRPTPAFHFRLRRLAQVIEMLQDVIVAEDIPEWIMSPHPALNGHAPISLLNTQYSFEEVKNLIEAIEWGNYS